MDKEIVSNRAKCLLCGDIITSYHRHDFVKCSCGNLFVDGGNEYLRRGYNDFSLVEELSLTSDAPFDEIRKYYCRGSRGKNGDQPLKWIPLCEMSDEHIKNCIEYNDELGMSKSYATYLYCKELKYRQRMEIKIEDHD